MPRRRSTHGLGQSPEFQSPAFPSRKRASFELLEARRLLAAQVVGSATMYATIQAAVNAASEGATVLVEAGTYAEFVTINKTLTLKGAKAGIDARGNARLNAAASTESINTGALQSGNVRSASFYVAADEVVLDGFTVQGTTSQSHSVGAGIVIAPGIFGTRILNNIVQNNTAGLFLASGSSAVPAVIQQNVFRNNNNPGDNGGRGIYTNAGLSGGYLTNVSIDNNAFINNRGSTGTTGLEAAIALESFSAGTQSNIRITNNMMDGNGKAVLFFNTTGVLIENNVITNTLDQYSGTLRFEGNIHDVTIRNNTIYDNTAPAIAVDASGTPGKSSGFVITQNNFYFNSLGYGSRVSVVFDERAYTGVPDVRNNWWGSSSGPGGNGSGSGDKIYASGRKRVGQEWQFLAGGSALFSPWSTTPNGNLKTAYWGAAARDGAAVQAEDYDHGGTGVGYSDTTTGNSGNQYRKREQVDLETTTDAGGGFNVGYVKPGEWLDYTVEVSAAGTYTFDFRVANGQTTAGKFRVLVDGVDKTGQITLPATGGWQKWQTVTKTGVTLTAGKHVVRLAFDTAGAGGSVGNVNWFKFTKAAAEPEPPPPPPPPPPTGSLPSGWAGADIGTTGAAGASSHANGTYSVTGSGADIWNNADAFQFVYRTLNGDGPIVARVTSMQKGELLAKAGIEIRDSLAANSKHVGLFVSPTSQTKLIRRTTTNGSSAATTVTNTPTPQWLKLVRAGSTITAYRSTNGVDWTLVGTQSISLSQTVYVGLAVTSRKAGATNTATFDNVTVG